MVCAEDRLFLSKLGIALVLCLFIVLFSFFDEAVAEYRVALVIGNGGYQDIPLTDPPNDAELMVGALENLGFEVIGFINVNKKEMMDLVRDFGEKLKSRKDSVGVFYYSGHGMEVGNRNYMIPVGVTINSENDVEDHGVDVNIVLRRMDSAENLMNFVLLDACRDNPFEKSFKSTAKGLSRMDAPKGTIIGFAAEEHKVALQGAGKYSYFTEALAREIANPGIDAIDMLRRVRVAVNEKTGGMQVPVVMEKSFDKFYFKSGPTSISKIDEESRTERTEILAPQVKHKPPVETKPSEPSTPKKITNSIGMEFVLIPTGSFTMGGRLSPKELVEWFGLSESFQTLFTNERPQHNVKISQSFYLQTTEVTQGQWKKVFENDMGDNPSLFKQCGEDCPVERVSWEDAQQFIEKLNQLEKTSTYRLPTEAEWEYACRAETKTEYSFGDDKTRLGEYAWYSGNPKKYTTTQVASKKPNPWGLYDMYGNVWELVADDNHDDYKGAPDNGSAWIYSPRRSSRVVRGGSWNSEDWFCRSAQRGGRTAGGHDSTVGFRLSKSVALGP